MSKAQTRLELAYHRFHSTWVSTRVYGFINALLKDDSEWFANYVKKYNLGHDSCQ